MSWICPHCQGRIGRPLAWMPSRPDAPPVAIELTPEEHAAIRRELARFRALLHLPPRPDTPPPEPAPRPVRVLARREVPPPAKPGWWRREAC